MPAIPVDGAAMEADLALRIATGEYGPPGSPLPRYEDLAELYSVGKTTVAWVVRDLKRRGLVSTIQGKGMFVGPAVSTNAGDE